MLKDALPSDTHMLVESRPLDKKTIVTLMSYIAEKHPEKYRDVLQRLHEIGEESAHYYGGRSSLTSDAFTTPKQVVAMRNKIADLIKSVRSNSEMTPKEKSRATIKILNDYKPKLIKVMMENLRGTAFPLQITSGSRGSEAALLDMVAGSLSSVGMDGEEIDTPIFHGYSEGLTPAEYWTTAYGSRLGYYNTKFATPVAGDITNQISLATQQLRVTEKDCGSHNGVQIDPRDPDYEGAVIATDYGALAKRNDVLTPQLMRKLSSKYKQILVRSPITCQAEYGICQKAVGKIPDYPEIGSFAGLTSAQSVSEPLSQASISSKHGNRGAAGGLETIKDLISVPSTFGGAIVAEDGGIVNRIEDTELGGKRIVVGKNEYFLEPGVVPTVKLGQEVERGDRLSDGMPNPSDIARLRGIGDARAQFVDIFSEALKNSGVSHNKRNLHFIAKGLINHVRVTEPFMDFLPDDIVEYNYISRHWTPRDTSREVGPKLGLGLYLEQPAGQYTIGTKLTKRMVNNLASGGFNKVLVNENPPPFESEMRRAMESAAHSDDWLDRASGYYAKGSLLDALYSGTTETNPNKPTAVVPGIVLTGKIPEVK